MDYKLSFKLPVMIILDSKYFMGDKCISYETILTELNNEIYNQQ